MITKSGVAIMAMMKLSSPTGYDKVRIRATDGDFDTALWQPKAVFGATSTISSDNLASAGVIFLEDACEPNKDEYVAPAKTNANLAITYVGNTVCENGNCIEYTTSYAARNKGEESITMNHIYYTISANNSYFLVDHTKLDEPVTIAPGETKNIKYTIRFNYPA